MRGAKIVPAIDLIDGRCVRLRQGDFKQQEVVGESPLDVAREFEKQGFSRLHVVDLSGARAGEPQHLDVVKAITRETNLKVDFSGGLRRTPDIEAAFQSGVSQVVIGSAAVLTPDDVVMWFATFGGEKIILGLDVLDGRVRIKGWEEGSGCTVAQVLARYMDCGLSRVMSTDIARDGTLQGPAVGYYSELCASFPGISFIASGGVSTAQDIRELDTTGVAEIIVGKALYSGSLNLAEVKEFVW